MSDHSGAASRRELIKPQSKTANLSPVLLAGDCTAFAGPLIMCLL